MSAQAQKFKIFEKKYFLGVRGPWLQIRNVLPCCGLHIGRVYLHNDNVARGFKIRNLILKQRNTCHKDANINPIRKSKKVTVNKHKIATVCSVIAQQGRTRAHSRQLQ